jgi:hypothetical protein
LGDESIRLKSIGRDLLERYASFADYVRLYGLQRSEGVLLRYLSQLYKTLQQGVPERAVTEPVVEAIAVFRTLLEHTDTSLIEEWESLLHPELRLERERRKAREALWIDELLKDPKVFESRVRAEMHLLVRALAAKDWEEAAASIRLDPDDPEGPWNEERFEAALAPFFADYGELVFTPEARRHRFTQVTKTGDRTWQVAQTLLDPQGDNLWAAQGTIDLRDPKTVEGPLVRLTRIGA